MSDLTFSFAPLLPWPALIALGLLGVVALIAGAVAGQRGVALRALFLAGEPLDEPTARWVAEWLGCPVRDNYWQTETGWPILCTPAGADAPVSFCGSRSIR